MKFHGRPFLGKNLQQKPLVLRVFFWAFLGLCWANVGPCGGHVGAMVGLCGAYVGPMLVHDRTQGPCWGHVEPMLSLCWGQERRVHLGLGSKAQMHTPFLGHVRAMLGLCRAYVGPMCSD